MIRNYLQKKREYVHLGRWESYGFQNPPNAILHYHIRQLIARLYYLAEVTKTPHLRMKHGVASFIDSEIVVGTLNMDKGVFGLQPKVAGF